MDVNVMPSVLGGDITVPPSKSAAHRAIIAASLACGTSIIHNVDLSSDIRATIGACENLGAKITMGGEGHYHTLTIDGGPHIDSVAHIDCAESGSTLRFFIPIACALPGPKVFTGEGRLPHRPIDTYYDIFARDGIVYSRPDDANLPLTVSGTLCGGDYVLDGGVSSQYITGMLFALPLLDTDSSVTITGKYESKGYVDMTVGVLAGFGIDVDIEGNTYRIKGGQKYAPQRCTVEGDYSQAAFFLVGGAIAGDIRVGGLKPDALQPDSAVVDILRRMGADITRDGDALLVRKSRLHGASFDVSQCPDLVPPLAIAAAFADGDTHITGAARLRIKESDRIEAMRANLAALGIEVQTTDDSMTIRGGQLRTGTVDSFGDHRITMAFTVAALGSNAGLSIKGAQAIDKSYPGFFTDLKKIGGQVQ